jgi:hypothetical protein
MIAFLAYAVPSKPQPPRDPGPPPEIYVSQPDGSGLRRLTEGGAYVDPDGRRGLVVSPDGRCIAHRKDLPLESLDELRVVCLDGQQTVVSRERHANPERPSTYIWLIDGQLAVLGTTECAGLLAVRLETGAHDCIVY